MSELAFSGGGTGDPTATTIDRADADDRASRRWRSVWRIHFYAGIFAAPILVLLALTGLVILYTQPINDLLDGDIRTVTASGEPLDYDAQAEAVIEAYPDNEIISVVTPVDDTHATAFGLDSGRDVYVDPYTGEVQGSLHPDGGIVGLANRLHGTLNNETMTVPLPTAAGIFGDEPLFADFAVGDLAMEIFACWGLVLAASGVYLWWPRKRGSGKALFVPRLRKTGRARWRDLHAVPGFLLSFVLVFFVISGLPWSGFWGANFDWAAEEMSPGSYPDPPASSVAQIGDLDRFGNQINWALQDLEVPASDAPEHDHSEHMGGGAPAESADSAQPGDPLPEELSLDTVVRSGFDEGLQPGYALTFPTDVENEDGSVTFGSYAAANPWPDQSQDAKTVFLDKFTGDTISTQELYGFGTVWQATDYTISTHMGTQFGLVNRILMTFACVALLWMVFSAVVMYGKRRRPGSAGLPRRPADLRLANRLMLIAVLIGLVYPLWGVSALLVLGFDRFVLRRWSRTRHLFGQRDGRAASAPDPDVEPAPAAS